MGKRNDLLSIGEISKLTNAGIQALRYYDRINILKPSYVDPDTGYRYYSWDQTYFLNLIQNCVSLEIPLDELRGLDNMDKLQAFIERNKAVAERKAAILNAVVIAYNDILKKMEFGKSCIPRKIYSREFSEKFYYLKPCEKPIKSSSWLEMLYNMAHELFGENFNRITEHDEPDEVASTRDFGYMCQYSPEGIRYYAYAEVLEKWGFGNTIKIPAGNYFFRHDESSKINDAPEIFKKHLDGIDTFTVVETEESFLSKAGIGRPMYELRLLKE
ncbi:MAG: MerR family DNA-binding transcriptional regulator [Defluviitaleaceae bacterium]|nr:MerR family DNA-binding transcriptional regulator [Defluviitaleaceae bacterium]